ncbi:MAG: hypothetical protein OES13_12070, partial [Acidimicrobiia bacterium]|nr:hypothetical protein [Acidimicrobiia bacterium]
RPPLRVVRGAFAPTRRRAHIGADALLTGQAAVSKRPTLALRREKRLWYLPRRQSIRIQRWVAVRRVGSQDSDADFISRSNASQDNEIGILEARGAQSMVPREILSSPSFWSSLDTSMTRSALTASSGALG